jgi:LmbE family N-acetylglucosaminyl deacetylase
MSDRRVLIAYAHPDDESFGLGGVIPKLIDEGADVYLICATDGDVGTIPEEMQGQYDSIRDLRLAELACATEVLRLKHVYKFGYKDSGMMGNHENTDPGCLWYNWQNDPETVTRRVVKVLREIQPQVVITFNKYGGYGHPDHIAIQQATTQAFDLAADASYITEGSTAYQPQKLYYTSLPKRLLQFQLLRLRLQGKDPRRLGVNKDIDFMAVLENAEPTHTVLDIRDYLEAWDEASACHKSQGGGSFSRQMPAWLRRMVMGNYGFTRIHPAPAANRVDEHDLFTNVHAEPIKAYA